MSQSVIFIVGALSGVLLTVFAARSVPIVGLLVGRGSRVGKPSEAAVDPESLPDSIRADDDKVISQIEHPELQRLLKTLQTWRPRRHQDEHAFHRSFERHLFENGYAPDELAYEPRVFWTALEREPSKTDRHAKPDFAVNDKVLVEIKRNISGSSDSDRALGQMLRYLIAWRKKGPALLLVCNEYDSGLKAYVDRYVRSWKAQDVPVTAFFVRTNSGGDQQ